MELPFSIKFRAKPRITHSASGHWACTGEGHQGLGFTAPGAWMEWLSLSHFTLYALLERSAHRNPHSPWALYIPRPGHLMSDAESAASIKALVR